MNAPIAEIERLVFQGYGPKRLAKILGGNEKQYRAMVRELGGAKVRRMIPDDHRVTELWRQGYGIKRMAKQFRCRPTTVLEILRRLNLSDPERHFSTSHGARLAAKLKQQEAEPKRIEALIMEGYKQDAKALKRFDESRHWEEHREVSRWFYWKNPEPHRKKARQAYHQNRDENLKRAKNFYMANRHRKQYQEYRFTGC